MSPLISKHREVLSEIQQHHEQRTGSEITLIHMRAAKRNYILKENKQDLERAERCKVEKKEW